MEISVLSRIPSPLTFNLHLQYVVGEDLDCRNGSSSRLPRSESVVTDAQEPRDAIGRVDDSSGDDVGGDLRSMQ